MRYLTVFLAAMMFSQPLWAQPPLGPTSAPTSQPHILSLPVGTRLTLPQGTFQGYNLTEFKTLLRIHADYRTWGLQVPLLRKNVSQFKELTGNLAKQLELQGKENVILQKERDRLTKKWTEENRLRHLAENRVSWTTWFAWGAAGVATLAATVLGVILAVRK